ncbi:MAG: hypothetical protein AAB425_12845, partial [Bdellovibrionota bacterium]
PIYVDANLRHGVKGEDVALRASQMGFKTVFLATGEEPSRYKHLRFLAGVRGKDPGDPHGLFPGGAR